MADFGAHLRQAREQRGISLRQIATATKISMAALEALERNDFSRLPGGIFSRAFVRAYAIEVGLDPEQTVQDFLVEYELNNNAAAEKAPPEVTADDREFLERQRRAARLLRAVLIGIVLLVAAGIIAWQFSSLFKSTASAETASSTRDVPVPAPSAQTPPVTTTSPPVTASAPMPTNAAPAPVPPPTIAPGSGVDQLALHVQVTGECWVKVTVDGTVLFEQTMQAGESRDFTPGREIYLTVGNAGAVKWAINGQPAKDLGKAGQLGSADVTRATLAKFLQ